MEKSLFRVSWASWIRGDPENSYKYDDSALRQNQEFDGSAANSYQGVQRPSANLFFLVW